MLGVAFSYALLAALATALLVAAATDLRRREIDNWLTAAIALSAPLYWIAAGLDTTGMAFQLGLAVVTFAAACALFAIGQMGGGDVKLLSALALWFVPVSFMQLIVMMGVIGGAASIAMAVFNMQRRPGESMRDGLSTLAAALWVSGACLLVYAIATGGPAIEPHARDTLLGLAKPGWWMVLIVLPVAAAFATGLRHIFRRQRGAIPVPYGVAISAAGLWILLADISEKSVKTIF